MELDAESIVEDPGAVCVESADPGGLSDVESLERLKEVGQARERIDGVFTEVAGELVKRDGKQATAWVMREYLRVSGFQARRDAALTGDLVEHGLSDTAAAMRAGEITAGHAGVIATAAPKPHRKDEAELLEIARGYEVDTCGRHTLAYERLQQMADDAAAATKDEPGDGEYRAQRSERKASLRQSSNGMWVLSGRFDYLADRDGGCISCRAHTEATHAHHIRFWSHNGPTDIPNLANLCPRCHDLVHDHNWQVHTPTDGHPKLQPPAHLRLPPDTPALVNPVLRT